MSPDMFKYLLLASTLLIAEGAVLGANPCTRGPSYWCQNKANAEKCSSTSFCTEKVWGKSKRSEALPLSLNADACSACEMVVGYARIILTNPQLLTQLQQELEKSLCSKLGSMSELCDALIDQELPNLLKMLNPQTICSDLKLCKSDEESEQNKDSLGKAEEAIDPSQCQFCETVVGQVKVWLSNSSNQEEVSDLLERVCGSLPGSVSAECSTLVDQFAPLLISYVVNNVDADQICTLLKLCPAQVMLESLKTEEEAVTDGPQCMLCELVIGEVVTLLGKNSTEQEIITTLEKVCSILPSSFSAECDTLIKQYGPSIISALVNDIQPDQICSLLHLCTSESPIESFDKREVDSGDGPQCQLCELVIGEVKSLISQNATEEQLITALEKVCSILPGSLSGECSDLIEQFGPVLIADLLNYIQPEQICTLLQLCTSQGTTEPSDKGEVDSGDGPQCQLCELVIGEVKSLVSQNATEEQLIAALEKVCSMLPGSLSGECSDLIEQFGPVLIADLLNYIQPEQICTLLKLCTSQAHVESFDKGEVDSDDGPQCQLCELVIGEVKSLISQNATEEEIMAAVEKVCSILPGDIADECSQLIEEFGPELIADLLNYIQPDQICKLLNLCTGQGTTESSDKGEVDSGDGPQCQLCELVIGEVKSLVSQNATEEEIIAAVEKVCAMLPSSVSGECSAMVEALGPVILSEILDYIQPEQICKLLNLCTGQESHNGEEAGSGDGPQCQLCELVIGEVKSLVSQNATEEQLIAALEKVCSILPGSLSGECSDLIEQFGPVLIADLLNYIQPEQICTLLNLCSSQVLNDSEVKTGVSAVVRG